MKQIILTLLVLLTVTITYGQNKYQLKKINYFVDEAVKEFSLDKDQAKDLLDARKTYFNDYQEIFQAAKEGNITQEEKKEQINGVNQKFNKYFGELTGKNWNELKPFFDKIRLAMENM